MKNFLSVLFIILLSTGTGFSEESGAKASQPQVQRRFMFRGQMRTPDEVKEILSQASLAKTGGKIREAGSAKGVFVILNAQKLISDDDLATCVVTLDKWARVQSVVKPVRAGVNLSVKNVMDEIRHAGGVLGVAIVDQPGLPTLLIAPESGWSMVNVRALETNGIKSDVLASRVRKEILRGFAFVTGGAYSGRASIVMQNVKKPADLDAFPREMLGLDVLARIANSAPYYGLTPWHQSSYKKACEEGWAPTPTNDIQRAIWNQVHAAPTKPIVIKPETKKQ